MTNPDRDELVKLAAELGAMSMRLSYEQDRMTVIAACELLRRLASSDSGELAAWLDERGEERPITAETKERLKDCGVARYSIPLYTAQPVDAEMRKPIQEAIDLLAERKHGSPARSPAHNARLILEQALTAPGATTKSDGCGLNARFKRLEKEATDLGYVLTPEPEHPDSPHSGPSDPSSTRSENPEYVVRKGGYFYSPKAQGYTSHIHEAGRWSKVEAEKYADGVEGVTIHPATEFGPSDTRPADVTVDELTAALDRLVNANALKGVRSLVVGWNGEDRHEPYNERHPSRLGATLPKTNCGAVYELDEAMQSARKLLDTYKIGAK